MSQDQFEQPADEPVDPNRMPIRNGRYVDPNTGETYQRVSNLLKFAKGDQYHLDLWKQRTVARGMALRPDLCALAVTLSPEHDKKQLDAIAQQAMEMAGGSVGKNRGNALHNATERLDRGEHFDLIAPQLPPPLAADLRAYRDLVSSAGFIRDPAMVERTVVNRQMDYAGTFDRAWVYRHQLSIVDVKSERDPDRHGIHLSGQLALYANATHLWHNGRLVPLDELGIDINCEVGYIIHIRNGAARLIAVDLRSGLGVARIACESRARHHAAKEYLRDVHVNVVPPPAADLASTMVNSARVDVEPARGEVPNSQLHNDTSGMQNMPLGQVEQALREATQRGDEPTAPPAEIDMTDMLLREIELAGTTARLAELYEIAQEYPGLWAAVELHAMTRGQIVACPQRTLHNPTTAARCACGWTSEHRP